MSDEPWKFFAYTGSIDTNAQLYEGLLKELFGGTWLVL